MSFQYDLFISYSSADRPWAQKLRAALEAKGITVFLDQERLDVGKPWEPQLAKAVQNSQHLVVLWSDKAEVSTWVRREVSFFETLNDPVTRPQGNSDNRSYSFVSLEGGNPAYSFIQGIDSLKEAKVYDKDAELKGSDTVNQSLWQSVVTKLADAIKKNDNSIPIPLAILAMTADDLQKLDPNGKPIQTLPTFNDLLAKLHIGDRDALVKAKSYGNSRTDWHPFGNPLNVKQILDNVLDKINQEEAEKSATKQQKEGKFEFRWEPIDERFWTDKEVARSELGKLQSAFSVIVIDPLSLYDNDVQAGFMRLSACFNSDQANIMVLTPFSLPQQFKELSDILEIRGQPLFDPYLYPPVPRPLKSANLGFNLGNEDELRRVMRAGVGQYVRCAMPPNKALSQ